jgi:hypothetical protein
MNKPAQVGQLIFALSKMITETTAESWIGQVC